jgi:hypothetical protein
VDRSFKKQMLEFRHNWGRQNAEERLIAQGLSKSMVQKLLGGSYPHTPKGLHLAAILRAMGKK